MTEGDVSHYDRQVLQGLGQSHSIAHLVLTPGDLFLPRPDGDELKIRDCGLARRIYANKLASLDYGMPGFVAPETAASRSTLIRKRSATFQTKPKNFWQNCSSFVQTIV